MSLFSATSSASGTAYTNTTPSFLVTSTSTATATSNVSQDNAQDVANNTAQQVANSAAQNDANIVSQTLNLTTANFKGQYSYLNIYEAVITDVGTNSTFTGVLVNYNGDSNSLLINYEKDIYTTNTLSPTQSPPSQIIAENGLKGFYTLTFKNNDLTNTSVLTGQRTSFKILTDPNGYTYNIIVIANVTIQCNVQISTTTTKSDLDGQFASISINNKMAQTISTYSPSGTFDQYGGVVLNETYSPDGNWNYLSINFDNGFLLGQSSNIYPYIVTN